MILVTGYVKHPLRNTGSSYCSLNDSINSLMYILVRGVKKDILILEDLLSFSPKRESPLGWCPAESALGEPALVGKGMGLDNLRRSLPNHSVILWFSVLAIRGSAILTTICQVILIRKNTTIETTIQQLNNKANTSGWYWRIGIGQPTVSSQNQRKQCAALFRSIIHKVLS